MRNYSKNDRRGGIYFLDGKPYVSVTKVLEIIDKPALKYWHGEEIYHALVANPSLSKEEAMAAPYQKTKDAQNRGITVHSVVESYKQTGKVIESIPEQFKGYTEAFYRWIEDHPSYQIVENEKTVVNKKFHYAGTLDMLIKVEGKNYIVDIKTNKDGNIYDEAFLQTSAYQYALREMGIACDGMFILALSETGKYTYREADDRMVSFLAALYLWYGKNKSLCQRLNYNVPNVEKLFTNTLQTTESSVQENALPLIG